MFDRRGDAAIRRYFGKGVKRSAPADGQRAIHMGCAGPAGGNTATEFGADHFQYIPDHPQKRGARFGIDGSVCAI